MLDISFGNAKCIAPTVSSNPAQVTCKIWRDRLGNAFIEGGNHLAIVNINQSGALQGYGYVTTLETPISLVPTITSLNELTGGTNGGTTVVIKGTFYPFQGSLSPLKVLFGAN